MRSLFPGRLFRGQFHSGWLALAFAAVFAVAAPRAGALLSPASANAAGAGRVSISRVRIVRVALAQGAVELNQQDGRGWQILPVNAPLSEGDQIRTGPDGRAEIQFEAGSTAQLIPNSEMTLQRMALASRDGASERLTDVAVTRGTAFFNLRSADVAGFRVLVPQGVATVPAGGHGVFRVNVGEDQSAVRVLSGQAEVASAGGAYLLKKNDLLTAATSAPAALAKDKTRDSWDQWSEAQERADKAATLHAELASYGAWRDGWWYPGDMPMGWSPFANGMWFYDPMIGYQWVSMYPWGWAPFHFGMWMDTGLGWAWSPLAGGAYYYDSPFIYGLPYAFAAAAAGGGAAAHPPGIGGVIAVRRPAVKRPTPPPRPNNRRLNPAPAIAMIRSGGAAISARELGTPAWYALRLREAPRSLSPALRAQMNAGQRAALNRSRATWRDQQRRVLWAQRRARERAEPLAAFGGPPGAALGGGVRGGPAARPGPSSAPRMMSPMPMRGAAGGGARMGGRGSR